MNTLLSLLLLVAARVDGVCVSYNEASDTSTCGKNVDVCKANPDSADPETFKVDGTEYSCCCSPCPSGGPCITNVGDDDCTKSDDGTNVPEACMNGKACSEKDDCGVPSKGDTECSYECRTNTNTCALVCPGAKPTCPIGCMPTSGSGARRLLRRLLFSSLPLDCGPGCEPDMHSR